MFVNQLTPEYIEDLTTEELEQIIRPCGFYKAKARTIQALTAWYRKYHAFLFVKKHLNAIFAF